MASQLIPLFIMLSLDVLILIGIIATSKKLNKLKSRNLEKSNRFIRDLGIGIASGLVVFVLTFVSTHLSFPSLDIHNGFNNFTISFVGGFTSLLFQVGLGVLITLAFTYWIFKDLMKKTK